jgi:hypothetical protein
MMNLKGMKSADSDERKCYRPFWTVCEQTQDREAHSLFQALLMHKFGLKRRRAVVAGFGYSEVGQKR